MKLSLILSVSVSDDSHQLETQSESDIEELNLYTELKSLAHVSPDNGTPLEVIRFIIYDPTADCKTCFQMLRLLCGFY